MRKNKNKIKVFKSIIELIVIVLLGIVIVRAIFFTEHYQTLDADSFTNNDAFIALSYFGVDRSGQSKYIKKEQLELQLNTLKQQGFETISQQDILNFYHEGTPLPRRALFLSFEDGRNDSSIFTQPLLEALNYKATMFTYADKMESKDTKFLKPKDLTNMSNSGFWEIGSNGYQLTYINVFNSKGEALGVIPENAVPDKADIEYYNHYLMDYFRDGFMMPTETRREMEARINADYEAMQTIYQTQFEMPVQAYAIMHANRLYHTMDPDVEAANDQAIKDQFSLHFNRDTTSLNTRETDIYNLSRLQVAPFWSVNHLLMRIKSDSDLPLAFETGPGDHHEAWETNQGVGYYDEAQIILTSNPEEEVISTLINPIETPFEVSTKLSGFVMGEQSLYLNHQTAPERLKFSLSQNQLTISSFDTEKQTTSLLYRQLLDDIAWNGEDYRFSKASVYNFTDTQQGSRINHVAFPNTLKNDRRLQLTVTDNRITCFVDGKLIFDYANDLSVNYTLQLAGQATDEEAGFEQYRDTIYDATFEDFIIKDVDHDTVIYTQQLSTMKRYWKHINNFFSTAVDYFIDTF